MRPYRPSNGTEGADFQMHFCDRCAWDAEYRRTDQGEDGCPLIAAAMLADGCFAEDYPKEWVEDDDGSNARCTKFQQGDDRPPLPDKDQGRLPL